MTVIYSNGFTLSSLSKVGEGDFNYQHQPHDKTSLANVLTSLANPDTSEPQLQPTSLHDLCTLSSMMARQIDNLTWQCKVLSTMNKDQAIGNLDEELIFLYHKLDDWQQTLQTLIQQQTAKTVEAWRQQGQELKLNLGAGDFTLPGWLNIDAVSPELPYNVLWGLPFANYSVQFVYSAYLLEHLRYPDAVLKFLQDIRRVLKPDGVLRLCIPHIKPYMMAYLNDDQAFFQQVESKWGFSFDGTLLEKVLNYGGVNHKLGVIDDHKFGYDAETLEKLLEQAGFTQFYAAPFNQSLYKDLRVDNNKLAAETYKGMPLSLIYEAVK